eukprot:5627688-Prymnesium_polylepis.2
MVQNVCRTFPSTAPFMPPVPARSSASYLPICWILASAASSPSPMSVSFESAAPSPASLPIALSVKPHQMLAQATRFASSGPVASSLEPSSATTNVATSHPCSLASLLRSSTTLATAIIVSSVLATLSVATSFGGILSSVSYLPLSILKTTPLFPCARRGGRVSTLARPSDPLALCRRRRTALCRSPRPGQRRRRRRHSWHPS